MITRIAFASALSYVLLAGSAYGHHSMTMFDQTKTIEVKGVVKEFQYAFPHAWLIIDVTGKDGKVTTWGFIAAGPPTLMRAGIRKGDFPPGTRVTVKAGPLANGGPAGTWKSVTRESDGKVFEPSQSSNLNAPARD